jgi:hypothetical protein
MLKMSYAWGILPSYRIGIIAYDQFTESMGWRKSGMTPIIIDNLALDEKLYTLTFILSILPQQYKDMHYYMNAFLHLILGLL